MNSNFWPCCFKALERRPGHKQVIVLSKILHSWEELA